jgi:hypothetical protein
MNNDDEIKNLIRWCSYVKRYPLPTRIAVRLHLDGITEDQFRTFKPQLDMQPAPLVRAIEYTLHGIDNGYIKITPDLMRLAHEL